jgi:hypothetical protein
MPKKPARPFIRNKDAESFVLVHRSQQDPEYYNADASRMVLMSAAAPSPREAGRRGGGGSSVDAGGADGGTVASHHSRGGGGGGGGGGGDDGATARTGATALTTTTMRTSRTLPQLRRVRGVLELTEVDECGLPLDGYDYSQHLAEGGGGVFVSADGRVHPGGSAASVARSRRGGAASESRSRRTGGGGVGGGDAFRESDEEADEEAAREALVGGLYATHEAAARAGLPAEVLPALPEGFSKDALDVVTLQEAHMPPDLREVLEALDDAEGEDVGGEDWALSPEDDAGEGEGEGAAAGAGAPSAPPIVMLKGQPVERLDDAFVLQALGKASIPEWPEGAVEANGGGGGGPKKAFDFDAHVARLMELAEGRYVDVDELDEEAEEGGGGWESEEDDENGDGGDGSDGEDGDDDDGGASAGRLDDGEGAGGSGATGLLAAMLSQYADSELGELAEDDARVRADGYAFNTSAPAWDAREAGLASPAPAGNAAVVRPGMDSRSVLQRLAEDFRSKQDGGDTVIGDFTRAAREMAAQRKALSTRTREDALAQAAEAAARGGEEGLGGGGGEERAAGEEEEEEEGLGEVAGGRGAAPPPPPPPTTGGGFRVSLPGALAPPATGGGGGGGFKVSLPSAEGGGGFAVRLPAVGAPAPGPSAAPTAEVPFGFAEGDFALDALDFFPENWRPSAPAGPRHDVETIVSTYSNTLHHPRRLADAPASVVSGRSGCGAGPRALTGGSGASVGSAGGSATGRVRVGKRSGLPSGMELVAGAGGVALRQKPGAAQPAALAEGDEDDSAGGEDEDDSAGGSEEGGGSSDGGDGSDGRDGSGEGGGGAPAAAPRERGEAPEARRARKAAVKDTRRARRSEKKALKVAFKEEARRQQHLAAGRDPIQAHVVKLD